MDYLIGDFRSESRSYLRSLLAQQQWPTSNVNAVPFQYIELFTSPALLVGSNQFFVTFDKNNSTGDLFSTALKGYFFGQFEIAIEYQIAQVNDYIDVYGNRALNPIPMPIYHSARNLAAGYYNSLYIPIPLTTLYQFFSINIQKGGFGADTALNLSIAFNGLKVTGS